MPKRSAAGAPIASPKRSGASPAEHGGELDEPSIIRCKLPEAGWIVLCSDGLWNYVPDLAAFSALVRQSATTPSPLALSRALVEWARLRGGKDNITVIAMAV